MATTVHIPADLLKMVDERAKLLSLNRNRFIVEAIKRALADQSTWSPEFLEFLRALQPLAASNAFVADIHANRRSKAGPVL